MLCTGSETSFIAFFLIRVTMLPIIVTNTFSLILNTELGVTSSLPKSCVFLMIHDLLETGNIQCDIGIITT